MGTVLGCIADDFTGATDLAGLLARSGVDVSLRMGVPETAPSDTASIEVIALKCRTEPVADAVAETGAALNWLRQAGAARFYWKYCSTFDSTAQGNIGPVAEALMHSLGCDQTIYCPAFPENARTVFMGHLFVGQTPLDESPMKDHPLTPMRDSNLMRLLQPQVTRPVGLIDRLCVARGAGAVRAALAEQQAAGTAHLVVDAVAESDLAVIAEACQDMPLITGGSALAAPLPAIYQQLGLLNAQTTAPVTTPPEGGAIVLSGSCSAMTRAQVSRYLETSVGYQLDPLRLARDGVQDALDWLAHQAEGTTPILYATADPDAVRAAQNALGTAQAGEIVEQALAQLALAAHQQGTRRFVVAGGETSGAVAKALGVTQLDIGPEIAPGVPWTFAQSGGHPVALALKSGNFGRETFFADALTLLEDRP